MDKKQRRPRYSPEVRERAVRMVQEHVKDHASQWAAITSIASKIGCAAQTLHNWVAQAERDRGERSGVTTDGRERVKALEREQPLALWSGAQVSLAVAVRPRKQVRRGSLQVVVEHWSNRALMNGSAKNDLILEVYAVLDLFLLVLIGFLGGALLRRCLGYLIKFAARFNKARLALRLPLWILGFVLAGSLISFVLNAPFFFFEEVGRIHGISIPNRAFVLVGLALYFLACRKSGHKHNNSDA